MIGLETVEDGTVRYGSVRFGTVPYGTVKKRLPCSYRTVTYHVCYLKLQCRSQKAYRVTPYLWEVTLRWILIEFGAVWTWWLIFLKAKKSNFNNLSETAPTTSEINAPTKNIYWKIKRSFNSASLHTKFH